MSNIVLTLGLGIGPCRGRVSRRLVTSAKTALLLWLSVKITLAPCSCVSTWYSKTVRALHSVLTELPLFSPPVIIQSHSHLS
ncbi:hypothetical protein F4824DRAFT_458375 [Ustulina deusta]|nr:hypothetical protein F4824DRAFT_458375 [Ustulina deusta]